MQAWDGGGTGAWYRVDTSCLYSFSSTTLIQCLPIISIPANTTSITDGFFISLGVFNRFNGVGLDIGLTYVPETRKWSSYANDARGWKSGSISVDSLLHPCINISLSVSDLHVNYIVRTDNGSVMLGLDSYFVSQLDPQLNLTVNDSNIGFYRFDSIAQTRETLKTGSSMIHAQLIEWLLELESHIFVRAQGDYMASSIRGYPPGPCCTKSEISTIHVFNETKWNQAEISIIYL